MTDTLDLIHRELDESLQRQLSLIAFDAELAEERLDDMVDGGNRRQEERMLDFKNPYRRLFREYFDQRVLVTSSIRTFEEQQRLYDRWQAFTNPDGILVPGHLSHRIGGMAIDFGDPSSAPLFFSSEPGAVSTYRPRYDEPWHFEYTPSKRKPWWKRAYHRVNHWWLVFRYERGRLR